MFKEKTMEEMRTATEENMILSMETGGEKKTDGYATETKRKSEIKADQTELLNQINMKMDALLAANNISL